VVGPDPRVAPGSIGSPVRSVNGRELFPGVHVPPGQGHAGSSVHPLGCSSYSLDKPTVRSGVHVSLGQGHVGSSVTLDLLCTCQAVLLLHWRCMQFDPVCLWMPLDLFKLPWFLLHLCYHDPVQGSNMV
jgi:hypothetical protein